MSFYEFLLFKAIQPEIPSLSDSSIAMDGCSSDISS